VAERLAHVAGADGAQLALLEPVDDDSDVETVELLAADEVQLAPRPVQAGNRQFGDQQDEIGLRQQ